jgi:hypothetical protein
LASFNAFLKSNYTYEDKRPALAIISTLKRLAGDVNPLSYIVDLLIFKLDIKIKKKIALDSNFGYSEIEVTMRSLSLESMYSMINQLPVAKHSSELKDISKIPNILQTLDQALCMLVTKINIETLNDTQRRECSWVIGVIDAILTVSDPGQEISAEAFGYITALAKDEALCGVCVHILLLLSTGPVGQGMLFKETVLVFLVDILEISASKLVTEPPVVVIKGKGAPKEAKKPDKKGAAAVMEAVPDRLFELNDPRRNFLLLVRLLVSLINTMVEHSVEMVTTDQVERMVKSLSKVVTTSAVWELVRAPQTHALHVDTSDLLIATVALFGSLSDVSSEVRRSACLAGGATTMLTLLTQSATAIGLHSLIDETELAKRKHGLLFLRAYCERSVLLLLTAPVVKSEAKSKKIDWATCSSFDTDQDSLFQTPSCFELQHLVDIFPNEDADLGNRCLRIYAALFECMDDPGPMISRTAFSMPKMSSMLLSRAQSLIALIKTETADYIAQLEAAALQSNEDVDLEIIIIPPDVPDEPTVENELISIDLPRDRLLVDIFTRPLHELSPRVGEAIGLLLIILEHYVSANTEYANALDINGQFAVLAQLIYLCGPVGVQPGMFNIKERVVTISDLRCPNIDSEVHLRALLFRLLGLVPAAYAKSRAFSSEVPPPMCTPNPESTSPCMSAMVSLCSECADACIATILAESKFTVCRDNLITIPQPTVVLVPSVLDSALSLWSNISKCSMVGLSLSISCTISADASFASTKETFKFSALRSVTDFINAEIVGESKLSLIHEVVEKKKSPKPGTPLFDKIFPPNMLPTALTNPSNSPEIWAYVVYMSAVVGVLSNYRHSRDTCILAVDCLSHMCRLGEFADYIQPYLADTYSAIFLRYTLLFLNMI